MIKYTPTLEELKQHFNGVSHVGDANPRREEKFKIDWNKVYLSEYQNWCQKEKGGAIIYYLWSNNEQCYANVITYEESVYEIY